MGFLLFLLVNATLFIRPAEIVEALDQLPIYNVLIVSCLLSSLGSMAAQVSSRSLKDSPISGCVAGLMLAVPLSNILRFDFTTAKETTIDFGKTVLYYFLLLAVLNSPKRIQSFLTWLAVFAMAVAGLALMQYHGLIDIPALKTLERIEYSDDGEASVTIQLRSTGIYNDPNDLCLLLVMGITISLHGLCEKRGLMRAVWLGPIGVFLYSLVLTRSRGGLLALMVALFTLFVGRFGMKKAVPLAALVLTGLMRISGGRQAEISVGQGTAQDRMEKWKEGMVLFAGTPLTGIGVGHYQEEVGLVAHNSFVHGYVEMGFIGGTLFVGLFYLSVEGLRELGLKRPARVSPEFWSLRPYILAMVAGYGAGLFSLSRNYIVPTYMIFGVVTTYLRECSRRGAGRSLSLDGLLVGKLVLVSVVTLVAIKLFLAVAAH